MKRKEISRRQFLKSGILLAQAAMGFSALKKGEFQEKVSSVSRTSLKKLASIPTTCELCPAGCGIIAFLNQGRLVQILGNPHHPLNKGRICAKGIAGINLANDPERILFPLKRTGPRGSGKWERITWDEAYNLLASRLKRMIEEKRIDEFVVDKGEDDFLFELFLKEINATRMIERRALKNLNRDRALFSMTGTTTYFEDLENCRFILNFGANPYANHDQFINIAHSLLKAQTEKGAKIITFDVRMSETASMSNAWYPIKSGTDGIVALAMSRLILENGLEDRESIQNYLSVPLSELNNHLKRYTLKEAEAETGIDAFLIEKLAIEFSTLKPSLAIGGGGLFDHQNGFENARAILLLNIIAGNISREGGLYLIKEDILKSPLFSQDKIRQSFSSVIRGITEYSEKIDTYFVIHSNPAYEDPECLSSEELLRDEKRIPFLVVMDTHLTETAIHADLFLPAASYLETWGIRKTFSPQLEPVLSLRQPVVSLLSTSEILRSPEFKEGKMIQPSFKPRGEAKGLAEICLELSKRIGNKLLERLPYKTFQDFIRQYLSSPPWSEEKLDFTQLKSSGFLKLKKKIQFLKSIEVKEVNLISTKLSKTQPKAFPLLPEYLPPPSSKRLGPGEFILTTFKTNLFSPQLLNSKWLKEIKHKNLLWMNKNVTRKMGIKDGEKVRLTSPVGSLLVQVMSTNLIHPHSVALAEGFGHKGDTKLAKGEKFKSEDQDTNLIWWGDEGKGVNPMQLIEKRIDLRGEGYGLKDTIVRIERIASKEN